MENARLGTRERSRFFLRTRAALWRVSNNKLVSEFRLAVLLRPIEASWTRELNVKEGRAEGSRLNRTNETPLKPLVHG